jgi:hypothetical protein
MARRSYKVMGKPLTINGRAYKRGQKIYARIPQKKRLFYLKNGHIK